MMKTYVPSDYDNFSCLMGACRHTCCAGWEIDVDEETLEVYRTMGGEMGEKIRKWVDFEKGIIRLAPNGACPFLTEGGLCEMIIELGEDSLCGICADHPRYRNFFTAREEIGLGLCCEAAGKMILGRKEKAVWVEADDDGGKERNLPEEEALLKWRDGFVKIAQDRTCAMNVRVQKLQKMCGDVYQKIDWQEWKNMLLSLEQLTDEWSRRLKKLSDKNRAPMGEMWEVPYEQLLVYLAMRHLPGALETGSIETQAAFVLYMYETVLNLLGAVKNPSFDDFVEICRLYSAEIEYSDENIGWILDYIDAGCDGN